MKLKDSSEDKMSPISRAAPNADKPSMSF